MVVLWVLAEVARSVRSADRVGLTEQVVGDPDVAVGVGADELREGGAGAGAHVGLVLAEQRGKVRVGLAALDQKLKRGALFRGDHASRKPTGWRFRARHTSGRR